MSKPFLKLNRNQSFRALCFKIRQQEPQKYHSLDRADLPPKHWLSIPLTSGTFESTVSDRIGDPFKNILVGVGNRDGQPKLVITRNCVFR